MRGSGDSIDRKRIPVDWEAYKAGCLAELLIDAAGVLCDGLQAGAGWRRGLRARSALLTTGLGDYSDLHRRRHVRICAGVWSAAGASSSGGGHGGLRSSEKYG